MSTNHKASHSAKHQQAIETSRRYLHTIKSKTISRAAAEALIAETLRNFAKHYNPGFLDYRKSVTEGGDFASVEWSGRGATFTDALGRTYLDCLGGYGLLSLGWSHQKVIDAVKAQLERAPMPTQELLDWPRGMLADLLAKITPGDMQYAFFVSSGTEAVEGAMKFAKVATGKSGFIAAVRGFHGKTAGSLSLMGKAKFRKPAMPLLPQRLPCAVWRRRRGRAAVAHCPEVGNDIAAVVMEPVQGEAGAIVPPDDFWPRLRQLCDEYDVLLIADEVQTGLGRTGALWGVNHWNVVPDIITSAKALGGGVMPIGAFMARPEGLAELHRRSVHPHDDHRRQSAGLRRGHRHHQRRAGGRPAASGRREGRLPDGAAAAAGGALRLDLRAYHRQGPAHRPALPRLPRLATRSLRVSSAVAC